MGEGLSQNGQRNKHAQKLRLQLLGAPRLQRRSGEDVAIRSKASLAMLLYLAVNHGHRQRREKLATLLWPDRAEEQARNSLRQALFTLKEALGDDAALVQADGDDVWLDEALLDVDAWPFISTDEASGASVIGPGQAESVGELAEGFEFNSDLFERWLSAERVRLRLCAIGSAAVPRNWRQARASMTPCGSLRQSLPSIQCARMPTGRS